MCILSKHLIIPDEPETQLPTIKHVHFAIKNIPERYQQFSYLRDTYSIKMRSLSHRWRSRRVLPVRWRTLSVFRLYFGQGWLAVVAMRVERVP